jgi:PAS domain S-box-containing protein
VLFAQWTGYRKGALAIHAQHTRCFPMSTSNPVQKLSRFIRERHASILNDWEGAVRTLPVARKLNGPALLDHIPDLLSRIAEMADELAAGKRPTLPKHNAHEHALDRLGEGFDLREVVAEYGTLRECILRLWERDPQAPGGLPELRLLDDAIDRAVAESVAHYVEARDRALQALDRVAAAAFESNDLDDFLRRLLDVLVNTTPAVDTAAVVLREGGSFRVRAAVGLEQDLVGALLARDQGLAGQVAAERQPVLISAAANSFVYDPLTGKRGARVLYGIPLVDDGHILGVAVMGSLSAYEFSKENKRLFSTMVNRATAAIFQHMMREAAETRARQQEAIAKLGIATIEIADAEQLVNHAVEIVARALETDMTGIFEVNADGSALVLRAGVGWNEGVVGRATVGAGRNSQTGYTLETAEPVIVQDIRTENRFHPPALLEEHGVVSGMSVIIYARGHDSRPYGVLGAFSRSPRNFSPDDVSFLQAVANFVAEAVERHRVEQSLRRSEARYRSLVTATSAAVWTTNAEGVTEEPSPSWQLLTGQSHEDYLGWGWLEMVHPDHRERVREGWSRSHAQKRTHEAEYLLRAPNGEYRWTHVRAVPVLDPDGTVREWVGMNVDITDRKRAEEQVQQALEQAQLAVRTRETVLALVSHDLRNPLNVISMNTTYLMKLLQVDVRAHKRIELIQRSVTRMACLIEDLLDMASIQAGKLSLTKDEHTVDSLVSEAVDSDEPLAAEKAIELKTVINVPLSTHVRCDRGRILQVFSNLLGNALKFSPHGSSITISAEVGSREVLFAIADQGPGIVPEQLPRIFEPFWRMQGNAQKGTGLGLYIAKAIIDAHGGRLWVDSKVGVGTTFYFTLPVA